MSSVRRNTKGETHVLPRGKKEVYRLWFEFLKVVKSDSAQTVDAKKYKRWGEVEYRKFDPWWEKNWRRLFGVRKEKYESFMASANQPPKKGKGKRELDKPAGIYSLTDGKEIKKAAMLTYLRMYQCLVKEGKDRKKAIARYRKLREESEVRHKGTKRRVLYSPNLVKEYGSENASDDLHGSTMRRYFRKAEKIAKNVAKGAFPGEY